MRLHCDLWAPTPSSSPAPDVLCLVTWNNWLNDRIEHIHLHLLHQNTGLRVMSEWNADSVAVCRLSFFVLFFFCSFLKRSKLISNSHVWRGIHIFHAERPHHNRRLSIGPLYVCMSVCVGWQISLTDISASLALNYTIEAKNMCLLLEKLTNETNYVLNLTKSSQKSPPMAVTWMNYNPFDVWWWMTTFNSIWYR